MNHSGRTELQVQLQAQIASLLKAEQIGQCGAGHWPGKPRVTLEASWEIQGLSYLHKGVHNSDKAIWAKLYAQALQNTFSPTLKIPVNVTPFGN